MDARCAPTRIGQTHLSDQVDELPRHGRATLGMPALPAPVEMESSPMPGDDGFGLHNDESGSPAVPELREPSPEEAVRGTEPQFAGTV